MQGLLEGKVCLITGTSRGIGKAIAERFAKDGAIVYANSRKSGELDEWADEISENSGTLVRSLYFDVCDFQAVKQSVMQIKKEQRHIDVLVNNAGIVTYEFLGMIDFEKLREMFEVNVVAMINLIQLVSRLMTRQKDGSIINMASIVGAKGAKGQLSYSATKGAVISLTKSAAKELAEYNIRVNAVAPGMIASERLEEIMENKFKERINDIGFKRLGTVEEVADVFSFLASSRSRYITGQVIDVDGGFIL